MLTDLKDGLRDFGSVQGSLRDPEATMQVPYEIHVNSSAEPGGCQGLIFRWAQNDSRGSRCLPFLLRFGGAGHPAVRLYSRDAQGVYRSACAGGTAEAQLLQALLQRPEILMSDLPGPALRTLAETLQHFNAYLQRNVPSKDGLRARVRVAVEQTQSLENLLHFPGCLLRRQDFMPLRMLEARLEQDPDSTIMQCIGTNAVSWLVEDAQLPPVQLYVQDPLCRRGINTFFLFGQVPVHILFACSCASALLISSCVSAGLQEYEQFRCHPVSHGASTS